MTLATQKGSPRLILALCFLTMLADGFDLIIYGATLPSLMAQFGQSKSALANVHSVTLAALMIGFLVAGPLADRIGRRTPIIIGTLAFSLLNGACAVATSFALFATFRISSGLFLGAVVPSVIALVSEYAPRGKRQLYNGTAMIGYPVGGILVTAVALTVLPTAAEIANAATPLGNWRWTYAAAGLFLILVPIMFFKLPESPGYLIAKGRNSEALRIADNWGVDRETLLAQKAASDEAGTGGYRLILSKNYLVATIIFTAVVFCSQVLTYGPNTWLPSMTAEMGFVGTQGTWALMMLSIGAIPGTIIGSRIADGSSANRTIILYYLLGAASLLALAFGTELGTVGIFIASFFTGFSVTGATSMMYGVIANHYPVSSRGSAVGFCVGVARFGGILGPQIGAIFVSPQTGLLAFMSLAILGAVLVGVLRTYEARKGQPEMADDIVAIETDTTVK